MCWSRHLVSFHEVKPVRSSIAVRRVWPAIQPSLTLLHIVSALVPPCMADVDCALCRQSNKRTLLLLLLLLPVDRCARRQCRRTVDTNGSVRDTAVSWRCCSRRRGAAAERTFATWTSTSAAAVSELTGARYAPAFTRLSLIALFADRY